MSKTILLIDDDEDDALFFSDALHEVAPEMTLLYCRAGQEALDSLTRNKLKRPDIIFLDINMPVVSGWECLREIKKVAGFQAIPIIMYSTADAAQTGITPEAVGAAAFYQKSTTYNGLKQTLINILTTIFH